MDDSDPFEGNMMACLERCDARTLRELKAVSEAWRWRARDVLGDSKSAWRQQPIWSTSPEGRALASRLGSEFAAERRKVLGRMGKELHREVELPGHAAAIVDYDTEPMAFGSRRYHVSTEVEHYALQARPRIAA